MPNRYPLYLAGEFLAKRLPWHSAYALSDVLSDFYFYFSSRDRHFVEENLKFIYDSGFESDKIHEKAKQTFRSFGRYLVDLLSLETLTSDYIQSRVTLTGMEYLEEARRLNKGVIIFSAHMGNWELGGMIVSNLLECPVVVIVRDHREPKVDRFFMQLRRRNGMVPVSVQHGLKHCLRALEGKGVVGVMADRLFGIKGLEINFLNQKISVPKGPAFLSLKAQAPLVPMFCLQRTDKEEYELSFGPPIIPPPCKSASSEAALLSMIKRYMPVIEHKIREHPEQWFRFEPL